MNNTSSSWIKLNLRPDASSKRKKNRAEAKSWILSPGEGVKWGGQGRIFLFSRTNTDRQMSPAFFKVLTWHSCFSGHGLEEDFCSMVCCPESWLRMRCSPVPMSLWARCKLPALVSTPFPTPFSEVRELTVIQTLSSVSSCVSLDGNAWPFSAPAVFTCKMETISAPTLMGCREGPVRQPRSNPTVSSGLSTSEEHNISLWAIIFHSLVSLHMLFPLLWMTFYLPDHHPSPFSSLNSPALSPAENSYSSVKTQLKCSPPSFSLPAL